MVGGWATDNSRNLGFIRSECCVCNAWSAVAELLFLEVGISGTSIFVSSLIPRNKLCIFWCRMCKHYHIAKCTHCKYVALMIWCFAVKEKWNQIRWGYLVYILECFTVLIALIIECVGMATMRALARCGLSLRIAACEVVVVR